MMLNSFEILFDYSDFEKKLKHYFQDTAPIYADVELRLGEVQISCKGGLAIKVFLDEEIGITENIGRIIGYCEQSLYPKMLDITEQFVAASEEQIKRMLFQGFTLDKIHEKQIKKTGRKFIITRFNTGKNSIDYKEEPAGRLFRAHLNRPLITFRDNILQLAGNGQNGMKELYRIIIKNSQIEELKKNVPVSADSD
jgi:hypothetical protein